METVKVVPQFISMEEINKTLEVQSTAMLMLTLEIAQLMEASKLLDAKPLKLFNRAKMKAEEFHKRAVYLKDLEKKANGREVLRLKSGEINVIETAQNVAKEASKRCFKARDSMLKLQACTKNSFFGRVWRTINPRRFMGAP
ncbi:MAG: hypothetical protein SP4CHLAM5_04230 [Chlamydiia bacterium]|nr:hypothetical protein [Chlamydiia bacterium]MCH9618296.1 hypothetical protein [Chlamydiia bacterium]MCH9624169.1 hypothetical protein [Chlamydiia bacterium]